MAGDVEAEADAEGYGLLPASSEHRAGDRSSSSNTLSCVFNLAKVIIGAGMMAIPQAYARIGWVAGTTVLVGVGLLTHVTLCFLLAGASATHAASYAQLARLTCGPAVAKALQLAIFAFCGGFLVVYQVIIRDILLGTPPACNGLLCEVFGLDPSSALADPRLVLAAVALAVFVPLLLLRSMERLAVLNIVGVSAIAALAALSVGLAASCLAAGTAHAIPALPQWQQLGDSPVQQLQALAAVLPVTIACYVAHQSLLPLAAVLQPYSEARMRGVVAASLAIAFAVFTALAVGSALVFGPALEVNVLNNFSVPGLAPLVGPVAARVLSWSIRGGYGVALVASTLLYMVPLRQCLAEVLWPQPDTPQPAGGAAAVAAGPSDSGGLEAACLLPGGTDSAAGGAGVRGGGGGRASVFVGQAATAAAIAAAGTGASHPIALSPTHSSGGGSGVLLSACDSMDNPRHGSWSGLRYLGLRWPLAGHQQQQLEQQLEQEQEQELEQERQQEPQRQWQQHATIAAGGREPVHSSRLGPPVRGNASPSAAPPASTAAAPLLRWQAAEQRWYMPLTYSLLAATVLTALSTSSIWVALSAIGDLASTIQAFIVPGAIGLALALRPGASPPPSRRGTRAASASVAALALLLGGLLFANGVYLRV